MVGEDGAVIEPSVPDGGDRDAEGEAADMARRCPEQLDFYLDATGSFFHLGTTGVAHDLRAGHQTIVSVETYGCTADCGACRVRGPITPNSANEYRRCVHDPSTPCVSPDDCPGSRCAIFFGPPVSYRARLQILPAPLDACARLWFEPLGDDVEYSIEGTVDFVTGAFRADRFDLRMAVALDGFCEQCLGDANPLVGDDGGVCEFSGRDCDEHGEGVVRVDRPSHDCPRGRMVDRDEEAPDDTVSYPHGRDPLELRGVPVLVDLPLSLSTLGARWEGPVETCGDGQPCWCGQCESGSACGGPAHDRTECSDGSACRAAPVLSSLCDEPDDPSVPVCVDDASRPRSLRYHCGAEDTADQGCFPSVVDAVGGRERSGEDWTLRFAGINCIPAAFSPTSGFVSPAMGLPGPMVVEANATMRIR